MTNIIMAMNKMIDSIGNITKISTNIYLVFFSVVLSSFEARMRAGEWAGRQAGWRALVVLYLNGIFYVF